MSFTSYDSDINISCLVHLDYECVATNDDWYISIWICLFSYWKTKIRLLHMRLHFAFNRYTRHDHYSDTSKYMISVGW